MQPVTVAFFGISGSGKGTQAELLERYLSANDTRGVVRPEMGNLLREFMGTGTPLAAKVKEILEAGGLVPSFMPIFLLTRFLNERFSGAEHLLLDGTCRRPDQSRAVDDLMRSFGRENLRAIVLKLSPESAKARLTARGRFDDAKDEAIATRFAWYEEHVVPSIRELANLGWQVIEVDGEPDIETIHKDILSVLQLAE